MKTADWKKPQPQPSTPFSENVLPFAKGDAGHTKLFRKLNRRGNGRNARVKTHFNSRGVIWNGLPFYWCSKGYYRGGAIGQRLPLQEQVWSAHHRRPVPKSPVKHVIIFRDGNKNNFSPDNLQLITKAEIATQNQRHLDRSRAFEIAGKRWTKQSRRMTSTLLASFNRGGSTVAKLK